MPPRSSRILEVMVEQVEHLSLRQLEQYRERKTATGEFLSAARHLAVCDACHRRFLELAPLPAQLNPLTLDAEADERAESFHLNYDEHFAPYVEGAINDIDREIVESHVELCVGCAEELREIFAVKEELARAVANDSRLPATGKAINAESAEAQSARRRDASDGTSLSPEAMSTRPAEDVHPLRPPATRHQGFFNSWRGAFAHWPARAVAGVFILALLISAAAVLWRTRRAPSIRPDDNRAGVGRNDNTAQPPTQTDDNTAQANHNAPAPNDNANGADAPTPPEVVKRVAPQLAPRREDAPDFVVTLNDGGRTFTLNRQNQLGGAADVPPAYRQLIRQALIEQRIEMPPELASLRDRAGRLRGGADERGSFALLSPAGTLTRTGQPVLRWQPLAGAIHYTVKIYDQNLNAVAVSPPLAQTEWTPPAPLPPGAVYSWQVTAEKDGATVLAPQPQEPRALFKVLPPARRDELQRAERIAGDSHLLRGLVYAKFGLVDEAEGELRKLQQDNAHSTVARRLAESLRRR